MNDYQVEFVDRSLPNDQKRSFSVLKSCLNGAEARIKFAARPGASNNDLIIGCRKLVPATPADLSNLVTASRR
jgi:hypothetical protein